MTTLFRSNTAQPSKLQQAIEKVTDGNQPVEDWALIMQICDYVGTHEESAKEAMKIIRKRLHLNPAQHGWRPIVYTLTLLEALTKNCGKIFHVQIAHKDFLKELKGVIGPKNNPPTTIQERVLSMIQTWALAFRNDPDLKTVDSFYQECRQHGLQFPPPEPESSIKTSLTPTPSVERPLKSARSMPQQGSTGQNRYSSESMSYSSDNDRASSLQEVSAEQLAKLRSELDVVQTNAQVFGEMLVTLQPGEESPQDYELLTELYNTCKQMQARVVELLAQITIDDITVDLLRYNDEFNNAFKSYDKYMQERNRRFTLKKKSPSPTDMSYLTSQSATNKKTSSYKNDDDEPSLIKFDDEPTTSFDKMRINSTVPNVLSRNAQPKSTTASASNRSTKNYHDPESDVKEVEQWLKFQGDDSDNDEQMPQEGGTTPAFDNFLQKRASAIPDETVSERQNKSQDPSKPFQKNNSYL